MSEEFNCQSSRDQTLGLAAVILFGTRRDGTILWNLPDVTVLPKAHGVRMHLG
jgi:hypothetical protein